MKGYVARRLLTLVPIVLGVTFLSFALVHAAGGDAVQVVYANSGMAVSSEVLDAQRADLGLDRPFLAQYLDWLVGMLSGDMGESLVSGEPVLALFAEKLPNTVLLATASLLATVVVSLPLGMLAAVRRGSLADKVVRALSFVGNALPNFFVALLLILVFSVWLKALPVLSVFGEGVSWQSLVLPTATLAIAMSSKYVRQVRAVVLEELGRGYVRGCRARGVRGRAILAKNVLKNGMFSLITLLALSVGDLLGGTAVVESVFMWDGVGKLAVDSVALRDYPVIQAYVVWMALIYVGVNLLADVAYHALDPRVRFDGAARRSAAARRGVGARRGVIARLGAFERRTWRAEKVLHGDQAEKARKAGEGACKTGEKAANCALCEMESASGAGKRGLDAEKCTKSHVMCSLEQEEARTAALFEQKRRDLRTFVPFSERRLHARGNAGEGETAARRNFARSRGARVRRDFTGVRLATFGGLAALLLLACAFAPALCPHDPYAQNMSAALQAPAPDHPFGTDRYGRDVLSRVIVGAQSSISATVALVALTVAVGTLVGVAGGWRGGKLDAVLMRVSDVFLSFPSLVFALAFAAVMGGGLANAVLALALVGWPKYARLARSQVLSVKNATYFDAARLAGCTTAQIIARHVLPNIAGMLLVTALLDVGAMMMELAGLSYLGLGAQPPLAEWGSMMSDGRSMLQTAPWTILAPGFAIFVTVAVANLLGDAARDWLDPKRRKGGVR